MDNTRVEYKVIPEKGIVIAKIWGTNFDAIDAFNKKFLSTASSSLDLSVFGRNEKFHMPYTFKAVSRCHPEDIFDEEKGKRIALNKLSEKYNRSLDKHLANIMLALDKALKGIDHYFEGRTF